jgi:hypothetical protein
MHLNSRATIFPATQDRDAVKERLTTLPDEDSQEKILDMDIRMYILSDER